MRRTEVTNAPTNAHPARRDEDPVGKRKNVRASGWSSARWWSWSRESAGISRSAERARHRLPQASLPPRRHPSHRSVGAAPRDRHPPPNAPTGAAAGCRCCPGIHHRQFRATGHGVHRWSRCRLRPGDRGAVSVGRHNDSRRASGIQDEGRNARCPRQHPVRRRYVLDPEG